MGNWAVLHDLVLLLLASLVFGAVAERLRQSAIVGFLLAGMILGPNVLGLVRSDAEVALIAELGVALLLFAIGLEFSWKRLRGLGAPSLIAGVVQVVATTIVAALVTAALGQTWAVALAIGAILALSSTASVLHVLRARAELESIHGNHALAILLVQDLAVVPLVLLVSVLSQGAHSEGASAWTIAQQLGKTVALGGAVVVGLYVIFNRVAPWLLRSGPMRGNRDLSVLLAIVSGLGSTLVAHEVGISPALGAFVAGLLLGESPFAVQVRADTSSLRTLFVTIFFSSIGMLGDPAWMVGNWQLLLGTVFAIVVGKSILTWAALHAAGAPAVGALAAAICLGQIGEFSFVLCEVARGTLLSNDVFQLLVSASVVTLILTPHLVTSAPSLAGRMVARRGLAAKSTEAETAGAQPGVLVVGFGPAGRGIAEQMRSAGAAVTVLDLNPHLVARARQLGFDAFLGDAQHDEVLQHVPAPEVAVQIIRLLRIVATDAFVVARARYNRFLPAIEASGTNIVHDEETYVGLRMAESMRELLPRQEVREAIDGEASSDDS